MLKSACLTTLIVMTLLCGCEQFWNQFNADASRKAMIQLLQGQGVKARDMDCQMLGSTRLFACRLMLDAAQTRTLIKGLKLQPKPSHPVPGGGYSGNCQSDSLPLLGLSVNRPPGLTG